MSEERIQALEQENKALKEKYEALEKKRREDLSDVPVVNPPLPTAGEQARVLELLKKIENAQLEAAIMKTIENLTLTEDKDPAVTKALDALVKEQEVVPARNLQMANKITAKIPKYGITQGYKWDQLVAHLQMTQKRNVYTEEEMKLILQDAMEGPAFEYIQANQHIFDGSYADALELLNDVFGKTRAQAMNELQAITQQPKETVELFAARLLNAADALKPLLPSLMRVTIVDGKRTFAQNPLYRNELAAYQGKLSMLDEMYVTYLVNGLRPEIRRQMRAEEYHTFAEARLAARTAERFLNHLATPSMIAGVEVISTPTQLCMAQATATRNEGLEAGVAYVTDGKGQLKLMEAGRKREKRDYSKLTCYRCGELGHIATYCNAKVRVESPNRTRPAWKYMRDDTQSGGVSARRSASPRSGGSSASGYQSGGKVKFGNTERKGRSPTRSRDYNRDCSNCRRQGRSCSYHGKRQSKGRRGRSPRRVYFINDDGTVEQVDDETKNE